MLCHSHEVDNFRRLMILLITLGFIETFRLKYQGFPD